MPSLFEISNELRLLEEALESVEGDEEQEDIIRDFLSKLGHARDSKIDNYIELIQEKKARAKALKERAQEMLNLAKREENVATRLTRNLENYLAINDLKKLDTERHRVFVCRNGGKPGIEILVHEDRLPEEFIKYSRSVNLDAIRDYLEGSDATEIEAHGLARFKEQGTHLRIS